MIKIEDRIKKFVAANDNAPVISGFAFAGGGGRYNLECGKSFTFTLEEARMIPDGYPKWPWDWKQP